MQMREYHFLGVGLDGGDGCDLSRWPFPTELHELRTDSSQGERDHVLRRSDVAISPPEKQLRTCHEEYDNVAMMPYFRYHEAPRTDDVGENDLKHGSSQLLVWLGFFHFNVRVDLPP